MINENKTSDTSFNVLTYTLYNTNDVRDVCHWSDGLKMAITKNGVTLELESAEIEKIIKSLPRTFGGSY